MFDSVAVTDLFPLANQSPCQAIRPHTDQSGAEHIDSFFLSRTIFSSPFWKSRQIREHLVSSEERSLSSTLLRTFHMEDIHWRARCHELQTQEPTYKPAAPKRTFSHSKSFTSAIIINLSLLCFQRSFFIYLYCQSIYSVMETNH